MREVFMTRVEKDKSEETMGVSGHQGKLAEGEAMSP